MAKNPASRTTSPRDVGRRHVGSVDEFYSDRVQTIVRLRKEGKTLRQIGEVWRVTGQRIRQLMGKIERRHDVELTRDSVGLVSLAEAARGWNGGGRGARGLLDRP